MAADFVRFDLTRFDADLREVLARRVGELGRQVREWARREAVTDGDLGAAWSADIRYVGQNFELSIPFDAGSIDADMIEHLAADFHAAHERAYGFAQADEPMELVSLRVKATGRRDKPALPELPSGRTPGGGERHARCHVRRRHLVRGRDLAPRRPGPRPGH